MVNAAGKLIERVRKEGIGSAFAVVRANLTHFYWRWRDSRFDRRHGVKTTDYILAKDLDVEQEKTALSSEYEPSSERILKSIFDQLPVDFKGYTFIDYGSGMGRVLLIASGYPFKQIVGVEFSPSLHETAQFNIKQYRHKKQKCFDIRSVCIDAQRFEIPEGPCVIYMFDPFGKEIMEKVANNIEKSYLAHPREIIIAYYAPVHREIFDDAGFLKEMDALTLPADRSALRQYKIAVYKTTS